MKKIIVFPFVVCLAFFLILQGRVFAQTDYSNYTPCPKRIIAYFAFWGDRPDKGNYGVNDIPWSKLTHINYAFAGVGENSKIILLDSNIAVKNTYPGQNASLAYKGQFNLFTVYKSQYPKVKTLISIGGWAESGNFYDMSATASGRETFANSCVGFLRQYGFDGIDIDWEYPTSADGATHPLDNMLYYNQYKDVVYGNYLLLMKLLREKLDAAGNTDKKKYLLSIAAPASSWTLSGMELSEHCKYLDYLNIMSYDLHGAWNKYVGPQAALYASSSDPETAGMDQPTLNIDWAVKYYSGIIHPSKINIGIPYYSRGWTQVSGGTNGLWGTSPELSHTYNYIHKGTPYSKTLTIGKGAGGMEGIWNDPAPEPDAGANPLWHVFNLLMNPGTATYNYLQGTSLSGPQNGLTGYARYFDNTTKSPWLWNASKQTFLTYEDTVSLRDKLEYIVNRGIGGMMFWELSGDYHYDAQLGYYVTGHDMTNFTYNYFNQATLVPATGRSNLPAANNSFRYSFSGTYSHPNYTPHFFIKNTGTSAIPGGWTMEFDLPKSARWDQTWGSGTLSIADNSHPYWTRYRVVSPGWQTINPGDSIEITGAIKLNFSGGPLNVVFNGSTSVYEYQILPEECKGISTGTKTIMETVTNEFLLYPNPGNGEFYLIRPLHTRTQMLVYDLKGALLLEKDLSPGEQLVELSTLQAGMYLVKMQDDKEVSYQKLILKN